MRDSLFLRLILAVWTASLVACSDDGSSEAMQDALDPAVSGTMASCQTCHGTAGEGNRTLGAPAIANLEPWYLERQLRAFREGWRGTQERDERGAQMRAITLNLDDETIAALAEGFANLDRVTVPAGVDGDPARGEDFYNMICGACHGPNAKGNRALNSPALTGIDGWYLVEQFENFRAGIRGTHPDDKYGRQMQYMVRALPEESDVRDVVAYIESIQP